MKNTVKIRITKMEYKRNCENFGTDIHIYTGNPSVLGGISF